MAINISRNRIQTLTIHESRRTERRDSTVTSRITPTQRVELDALADEIGVMPSELINQAITTYVELYPVVDPVKILKHKDVVASVLANLP